MCNWKIHLPLIVVAIAMAACGSKPAKVNLGVDLYLHPDSAEPADVMLQAAIQDRISKESSLKRDVIHVRVYRGNVFLSGSAKDPCTSGRTAQQIADSTTVHVNGGAQNAGPIKAERTENHILGPDNQPCRG